MNREKYILKKDTPYHKKGTEFYEELGYLRNTKDPAEGYRLISISNLKKWFKKKKN